jgi:hypothetical protein
VKFRPTILRLWLLASVALGAGFLFRNRLSPPSSENASNDAPRNSLEPPAMPASYSELLPSTRTPESKACCEKPPSRAALMRTAP